MKKYEWLKGKLLSPEELDEITERYDAVYQRRKRAAERLAVSPPGGWHFAIMGLEAEIESPTELTPGPHGDDALSVSIRPVEEFPQEYEIQGAISQPWLANAIARYGAAVKYELAISAGEPETTQFEPPLDLAALVLSALRLSSRAEFLVPAYANHSWSTVAGVEGGECVADMFEDYPMAFRLRPPVVLTSDHINWVRTYYDSIEPLLSSERVALAIESFSTHNQHHGPRMAVATLWSGIESLFDFSVETRFRLAAFIAALLEEPGEERLERYHSVRRLYQARNGVVHGKSMNHESLRKHARDVSDLLADILVAIVERGEVPTPEELDRLLFT